VLLNSNYGVQLPVRLSWRVQEHAPRQPRSTCAIC
jgi:hypothetical protein